MGFAFAFGFLVGAWAQRRLKAEVALVEARKNLALAAMNSDERYEEPEETVGLGHPGGMVPPTHDQARRESKKAGISSLMKRFGFQ